MTEHEQDQLSPKYRTAEIQALKNTYNQRLDSIFQNLQQLLDRVQSDDLISAMKVDPISQQFVQLRVKEMFSEGIQQEKEDYIERLAEENAECKSLLIQYQDNLEAMSSKIQSLQEENLKESAKLELAEREKQNLKQKLERSKTNSDQNLREKEMQFLQEFDSFKHDSQRIVQDMQGQIKSKQHKIEEQTNQILKYNQDIQNCTQQIKHQQEELIDLKSKLKKLANENDLNIQEINSQNIEISQLQDQIFSAKEQIALEIGQKQEFASKIDELNDQIKRQYENEQLSIDNFEQVKNEFKVKIKQYKKKLLDYKNKLNIYENEIASSKRNNEENKYLYEKSLENVQEDLKQVKDEWYNKLQQEEQAHKQIMADTNSKFSNQLQSIQTQYQAILDEKIHEIQIDAQTQVQKAQHQAQEIQKLMEVKISNLEKDLLLNQKNYAVLEERMIQNQQAHDRELQQKDEIFQYELNKKVKKAQQEKHSEIENSLNKISALETQIMEATSTKAKLEASLEHEKQVSGELSEKVNKLRGDLVELEQSKKNLIQHLDEGSSNLTKLKQIAEDERRQRKKLEEQNNRLENTLSSQTAKQIQVQNELERQTSQLQNEIFIAKQNSERDLQNESNKFRDLSQQFEHLQMENIKLKHEKESLTKQLDESLNLTKSQIQEMKKSFTKTKEDDSEKLKQECILHAETKNVLIRTDTLNQQLKGYVTELESKLNMNQEQNKVLEKQIKSQMKSQNELSSELQKSRALSQDLQKRLEFHQLTSVERRNRIVRQFTSRLNNLRNQLLSTKSYLLSQITIQDKEYSVKLQELLLLIKEKTEAIKRSYNYKIRIQDESFQKESKFKIQDIQMENKNYLKQLQLDYDNKIKFYKQENEALQKQNLTFQSQFQNSQENAKSLQDKLSQIEQSKNEIMISNDDLRRELEQQQQQFESLRIDVKYETDKLKQESDNLLEMTYNELDKRHKKEIESCTDEIQSLKKQYQEQIDHLELTHNQDIENQQNDIETRLRNDIQALDLYYKQEIKYLLLNFEEIQSKYKSTFEGLEQSLETMTHHAKFDKDEMHNLRKDKEKEIEALSEHLKQLSKELINRTKYCEELSKDKELARSQMREIKRQLDIKDLQLSQRLKEIVMAKTDKDKELQELKILINQIPDRQFLLPDKHMNQHLGKLISTPKEDADLSISQLRSKD